MKNYVQDGATLDYPNTTGATIVSGTAVVVTDIVGVAMADIANLTTGVLATEGVFTLPKLTGAITQGAKVYLTGAGSITTTATGNIFTGRAWEAALSAATAVNVRLDE